MFFLLKINALELVSEISVYCDKNTCDRSSTCGKTVPTFQIPPRDMIENSRCLILMES